MMETAVENVLENAVSFTPASGIIRVRAYRDGRGARIMIEDEGPGVPADRLHRIFDRYYSVRPASAASAAGNFGIGLWIVRRNVEAMGGRVWAENRRQGGLRVTIEFPAV
jgi:two-component system sensor histidine kinase ChvG